MRIQSFLITVCTIIAAGFAAYILENRLILSLIDGFASTALLFLLLPEFYRFRRNIVYKKDIWKFLVLIFAGLASISVILHKKLHVSFFDKQDWSFASIVIILVLVSFWVNQSRNRG
jgi:hypothetical protein